MNEPNQRNKDALGDTNAPGTITNFGVVGSDGKLESALVTPSQREVVFAQMPGEVTRCEVIEDPSLMRTTAVVKTSWSEEERTLIKAMVARDCTDTEFALLMYLAKTYGLDPLAKQIWAVKFGNSPAQIYAGRDGFLAIAHRSGHFNGMESKVADYDDKGVPVRAVCEVWRNDMAHSFKTEVLYKEYSTGKGLWTSKPSVMLIKVAESVCLRKAFPVSGLYCPEEMDR